MKKRSELLFSLIAVLLDYLMIVVGFVVAYLVRVGETKPLAFPIGGHNYLSLIILMLPVWVIIFALLGLYNMEAQRGRMPELLRIMAGSFAGTMVLIMLDFFSSRPIFPSKSIAIYGLFFAFIFVAIGRFLLNILQRQLYKYGIGSQTILVLGHSQTGMHFLQQKSPHSGIVFINHQPNFRMPYRVSELDKFKARGLGAIIQVFGEKSNIDQAQVINWCSQNCVDYRYVPALADTYRSNIQTGLFLGQPIIALKQTPLDGWGRIIKRFVDIFTSLLALIVLSPLYIIIALVIKIVDPGPVFFSHTRLSRTGKTMKVYKFRSMRWRYCDGGPNGGKSALELIEEFGKPELVTEFKRDQKLKDDPRVSPIGRFLRRTSLDELPQFFNVLKGDLSLVGPRPIVEGELARYGGQSGIFLAIRPGLTGLWQVSGRNDISYNERVKLDIYYIENWNLFLDLSIVLKTVGVLLRGGSGY